jgi:hypothetical protein
MERDGNFGAHSPHLILRVCGHFPSRNEGHFRLEETDVKKSSAGWGILGPPRLGRWGLSRHNLCCLDGRPADPQNNPLNFRHQQRHGPCQSLCL